MGTTVLVSGANGFVGTRVHDRLTDEGAHVRALVRRPTSSPPDAEEVVGDFTDLADARRAVAGVDAVVHCAATAGDDRTQAQRVNVDGTRVLAEAALEAGVARFVHVSTTSVYDRAGHDVVDEDTPLVTDGSVYAATKAAAEREVAEVGADGLVTTILRPTAVLGWGPTSTWGQRVPTMIANGTFSDAPPRDTPRAWVHVDDLANAVALVLTDDRAIGGIYNVVAGQVTWGEYIDAVLAFMGDTVADPLPADATPTRTSRLDGSRIVAELGFHPRRTFAQAMSESALHWSPD